MIRINNNYLLLQGSYLFAEIAKRFNEYTQKNPSKKVIKLGIGDVTEPLTPAIIKGLEQGVKDMSNIDSFKGYKSDNGYEFLIDKINHLDFKQRGVKLDNNEIFITCGAKEDTANFQELFAENIKIAITDPVYPVYIDSNVMAGRSGNFNNGRYENIVYLDCTADNNFIPEIPKEKVDLIYLCFPNNPTGQTITKSELAKWVKYARENKALILFDAAYEAFIKDDNLPHSIFEIEGAKEVAVEFRSLSKTAGFTGTRLGYTIVPKEVMIYDKNDNKHSLNKLWERRQSTKFNGVSYIIQRGACEVFTENGRKEINKVINFYLENAKIIKDGLTKINIKSSGGINSPYIWLETPNGYSSWDFFTKLLEECQVVGTPGVGFGKCGEGHFRLSAFGDRANIQEAVERLSMLKL